jgi:hypothetical protein
VCAQPLRQSFTRNVTGGKGKHEALLVINTGAKLHAVHDQEDFHGGMRDAFVAVGEPVVSDKGIAKRGSLVY